MSKHRRRFVLNHMFLPARCRCGEKNMYWVDGTYGCVNGHVTASRFKDKEFSLWYWGDVNDYPLEVEKK